MEYMLNKYKIQVPKDVNIIYSKQKKILVVKGSKTVKTFKVYVQLMFAKEVNWIYVLPYYFFKVCVGTRKRIKSHLGSTVATLKQLFIETSNRFYKKLKFVGVGY